MKKRWLIPTATLLALVLIALVLWLVLGNGGSRDEAPAGITDNLNWPGEQTPEPETPVHEEMLIDIPFAEEQGEEGEPMTPAPTSTETPTEEPTEATAAAPSATPKRTKKPRSTATTAPASTDTPTNVPTNTPTPKPTNSNEGQPIIIP